MNGVRLVRRLLVCLALAVAAAAVAALAVVTFPVSLLLGLAAAFATPSAIRLAGHYRRISRQGVSNETEDRSLTTLVFVILSCGLLFAVLFFCCVVVAVLYYPPAGLRVVR